MYLGENSPKTLGTVINVDSIKLSIKNGTQIIYKFSFRFKDSRNNVFEESCYSLKKNYATGETVTIYYYETNPNCSRIKDTTIGVRDIYYAFPMFLLIWLSSITFLISGMMKGRKKVIFLRIAEKTTAVYTHQEETNIITRNSKFHDVYYQSIIKGVVYQYFTRTTQPQKVSTKNERVIFYNPQNPQEAIFEDEIFT